MKITIKITELEITIDDDSATPSLVGMLLPLLATSSPAGDIGEAAMGAEEAPATNVPSVEAPVESLPVATVAPVPASLPIESPAPPRPRAKPVALANDPAKRRLGFDEFDRLVRSEMKRLAVAGTMPGHRFWDEHRTSPLPTLQAVIARYSCQNATELATKLGYHEPLGTLGPRKSADTNGISEKQDGT